LGNVGKQPQLGCRRHSSYPEIIPSGPRSCRAPVEPAAAWPVAARAQQHERLRTIGIFMPGTADNVEFQDRIAAFLQALGALGWAVGGNVRVDYLWGAGRSERYRTLAEELVALAPDVILGNGTATVNALKNATRTVPIVFANIADPVGSGLVASLARPGGNVTGFISQEFGFSGKWVELLKEVAPRVTRTAVTRDSAIASQIGMFGSIQSVALSLGIELRPIDLRDSDEIEHAIADFAREPNGGLIVPPAARAVLHSDLIIRLAARHGLPAIFAFRGVVARGGLMSYGSDSIEVYRQAAGYVDRIFKGEKPADLPVQSPTKYQLVINLKTAKALDLEVPPTLLARADEVIE
jgi:putative ABC transport system substrate-binding protein